VLRDGEVPSGSAASRPRSPPVSASGDRGRRNGSASDARGIRGNGAQGSMTAPSTAHGGQSQSQRSGREGYQSSQRSRDSIVSRRLQEPFIVSSSQSHHFPSKALRKQGSLTAMPAEGRSMLRSSHADAKNAEAINNLVSIFRGNRLQDVDQQPAPEPLPETGAASPPVAPSPPVARLGGSVNARAQQAVFRPHLAWDDRDGADSPDKPRAMALLTPSGSSPVSSPPMPPPMKHPPTSPSEVRAMRNTHSPGAPIVRSAAVPAIPQPVLLRGSLHSASARSLASARTPSPCLERSAHSASARCLRTIEPRSASVSHSPEPHSHSRSPGPSDRCAIPTNVARRAPSPVMIAHPPAVQTAAFLPAATACSRNSRATWPTPAMHAQMTRAAASQQAGMPTASGTSPRTPGIVLHGPRRR